MWLKRLLVSLSERRRADLSDLQVMKEALRPARTLRIPPQPPTLQRVEKRAG
jgi:hypothetical protein